MNVQHKLAISPVAAAVAAAVSPGQALSQEAEQASNSGRILEEIVVSARKRTESVQDAPIAIQALSQEALAAMGAKSMEDYARFIPSMSVVTYNNSSNIVVFRGAITSPGYIAASTSSVYLDEISLTITGSQPGVRMVDIARVEALSGPQGTLYGSDAQAGTLRIVTNKPDPTGFEAVFDGEVRTGSDSDTSYRGSVMLNLPLADDKAALRLVAFNDYDAGYIDNVYGHTADQSFFYGDFYPADFGTLDNSRSVEKAWNDTEIYGGRASLLWNINDDWAATFGVMHQTSDSGADNYYDPFVGDLQTVRFHDEYTEDKYDLYSLTLEGDLGFAQLVSATSYFDRTNNYLHDVTTYAHYWTALYCVDSGVPAGPNYAPNPDTGNAVWWPVYCHAPNVDGDTLNAHFLRGQMDKFTQEIRLSSQGETIDWLVGLFYETSNDDYQSSFGGPTTGGDGSENLYQQSLALANYELWRDTEYPEAIASWYSDNETDWKQSAVFGEVTWHLGERLDLTFGGRYYDRSNTNYYFVNRPGSFTMPAFTPPPKREGVDEEFIPKFSVSYSFDSADARMAYGLYTRGKRPGGINRQRGEPFFPAQYDSDLMDNYEFGYKSTFGSGSGRFNVTAYHMEWSEYQHELTDPSSIDCPRVGLPDDESVPGICGQPWQRVVANLGDAHMTGVNVELDIAPTDNLVLGLNAEFMEAETDSNHDLNADGEPDIVAGLRLPLVPEFKGAAWAEYHWPVQLGDGQKNAFVRTQWSYNGDSVSIIEPVSPEDGNNPQFTNSAYTIGDLRFGIQGEDWEASIFVNNITDERADLTHADGNFDWGAQQSAEGRDHHLRIFTNRPREYGVRFMKRWGD